jgi:hypothetical protein
MQIAVEDKTGALLALFNRHFHKLVIQRGIESREGAIRDLVYAVFGSFPENVFEHVICSASGAERDLLIIRIITKLDAHFAVCADNLWRVGHLKSLHLMN